MNSIPPVSTIHTSIIKDISISNNTTCIRICQIGIPIHRSMHKKNNSKIVCLCPPSHYGEFCQYQSQRISVTVQIVLSFEWHTAFVLAVTLLNGQYDIIQSYDQVQYLAARDCNKKFNIYLLYKTRPKNLSTNYSVRFDVYNKHTLEHRASWLFSVRFPFLPVYRLPVQLYVPPTRTIAQQCEHLQCGTHGHCLQYVNTNISFCFCDEGWSGKYCNIQHKCNCAIGSLCLNSFGCLCPLNKYGPRCYLKHTVCSCKNGGTCAMNDERAMGVQTPFCICPDGFSGPICENNDTKIEISFAQEIPVPLYILVHFIEAFENTIPPKIDTVFRKVKLDEDTAIVYRRNSFHIVFVEIEPKTYYLVYLKRDYTPLTIFSFEVFSSNRCASFDELFNQSFTRMHLLRRMKYYYVPCQQKRNLACFYDKKYMCICDPNRNQSNCLEFNHNVTYNCQGRTACENEGECFNDDPKCPTSSVCICAPCSYGSRCQFLRNKFDLSLDSILGYQIRPKRSFSQQSLVIKLTVIIVVVMLVWGLTSGILSIVTFTSKTALQAGCGYYLLISSWASLILMILFGLKVIITITSHMAMITNRSFLSFNCIISEYVIKILLSYIEWLHVCVAIERAVAVIKDNAFNQNKMRWIAKRTSIGIFIVIPLTYLQDPIHRILTDDGKEDRLWCVAEYSSQLDLYNSIILFFHFLMPFVINIVSAIIIIIKVAQHRAKAKRESVSKKHVWNQIMKFKHLLISPLIVSALDIPRLIVSFLLDCKKSSDRNSWSFLAGYLAAFVSPVLIFFTFVLSSSVYKAELKSQIKSIRKFIKTRARYAA